MIKIPVDYLELGKRYEEDIADDNGAVLIPIKTAITEDILDWLKVRNVHEVFTDDPTLAAQAALLQADATISEADNIERLDFLEQLHLDELYDGVRSIQNPRKRPNKNWYLDNPKVKTLETRMTYYPGWDRPKGQRLSMGIGGVPDKRSITYKETFLQVYADTLNDVKILIDKIADGRLVDVKPVLVVVEKIIEQFLKDKNLLINCSFIKSSNSENLYHHSLNVCILAINIASATGYNYEQVLEIGLGALLHDIGMIFVMPEIRYKSGPLTPEELTLIHKHPLDGLYPVSKLKNLPDGAEYIILQHHEREDGSGYPKARPRTRMHRYARIVAVADVFDAMTGPRPYRKALHPYQAMLELLDMVRRGKISSDLAKFFLEYASIFPIGSFVKLSDGSLARVVDSRGVKYVSPVVRVIFENDQPVKDGRIIDLSQSKSLKVIDAIPTENVPDISLLDGF